MLSWLLGSAHPSVRYFTLVDLLDRPAAAPEVRAAHSQVLSGSRVRALLAGQCSDGGFGVHPYKKWNGAHWRLVSLVELGVPAGEPHAVEATEQVLRWLTGRAHLAGVKRIRGLVRRCASQEGNALAVCSRLGLAGDPRVQGLARSLVEWQWPDGGWNCDRRPGAHHSSFYESLAPLWGLLEYRQAAGEDRVSAAIDKVVEFFLRHNLFRSERSGKVIVTGRLDGPRHAHAPASEWLRLHYPLYWHYDILQALRIVALAGRIDDPRATEALDILEQKRRPDGRWEVEGTYWYPARSRHSHVEVVDWGRKGPNEMITLNALRVLKAAGRWTPPLSAAVSGRPSGRRRR